MVRYAIDDITDEMVLGESIFLPSGELLLAAGFRLTERYRNRLRQMGFSTVGIQIEGTEDVHPEEIISDHVQREVSASVAQNAKGIQSALRVRKDGVQNVRKMIRENRQYLNKYLTSSGLARSVENLIEEILKQPSVVLNMSALSGRGGELFAHAINVTVTSLCIGRKYHFSYDEMKQLAMGAINYDLGLVALPKEIVDKDRRDRNEEELAIYKQHTVYGYLMLSQNPSIAPTSAAVAVQHHEHQNGSGYPRGLHGENRPPQKDFSRKNVIHRFAEIVAVADRYNAFTTGRYNSDALSVRDALREIIKLGGDVLNSDIVKTLTGIIPVYPVGARIRIADSPTPQLLGYYGVVARDNPDNLEQPQIILYESRKHQRIKPILVNCALHTGFTLELVA